MHSIEFSHNYNGKLFLDHFGAVLLYDAERYYNGNIFAASLKGKDLGTVKVVGLRSFAYKHISDVLAYVECGQPAHYLGELIKRTGENEGLQIEPGTRLDHVIFSYTQRNLETHQFLLQEWWHALSKPKS